MIWISSKRIQTCYALKGDAFNQQLQNLINKYPEIKKSMKSDFIAYYDKKSTKMLINIHGIYKYQQMTQ